jgi:DNA-binding transcriptional MerR regulator
VSSITAELAQRVLGINPSTLRTWVQRGYVRKLGRDRYDLEDVRKRWILLLKEEES